MDAGAACVVWVVLVGCIAASDAVLLLTSLCSGSRRSSDGGCLGSTASTPVCLPVPNEDLVLLLLLAAEWSLLLSLHVGCLHALSRLLLVLSSLVPGTMLLYCMWSLNLTVCGWGLSTHVECSRCAPVGNPVRKQRQACRCRCQRSREGMRQLLNRLVSRL
jgi:hypothetical protein